MPKYLFFPLLFVFLLQSCGENPVSEKTEKPPVQETKIKPETKTEPEVIFHEPEEELVLFDMWSPDETTKSGFISLSDIDPLSENEDSLAIPDVSSWLYDEAKYFKLDAEYRKRFLARTKISENDRVFIYNYSSDLLVSVPVKELKVVVYLSVYVDEREAPFSQMDYHIGFEVNWNLLKGFDTEYFAYTLVSVGKENPFIKGKMKPVKWKKMDVKSFPLAKMSGKNKARVKKLTVGKTTAYSYTRDSLSYFMREMFEKESPVSRCVLVLNNQTDQLVFERIYEESEGTGLAPLNGTNSGFDGVNQWSGQLFKNRPPVLFGFQYYSFGCPEISFLKKGVQDVYINCDNRH